MISGARIGIVTAFLGNLRAGTWVYTSNLLQGLSNRGVVRVDRDERLLEGLEQIPVVVVPGGGRLAKLTWPNLQLPNGAERGGLDLVHVTTPYGCFRKTRFKKVITICDVTPLLFPDTHGGLHVWHHRLALPSILRAADGIITISEASKRDIVRCFRVPEEKVSVIYLAASLPGLTTNKVALPPDSGVEPSKPYILNVGTLEPRKNLAGLLKAFSRARRMGLPHSLVIVGAKGWGNSPVAGLAEALGISEHVHVTGFVDDQTLPLLYAGADFFVYPSLYEGFGLPVLEAMACGTPVITSNLSSMPEVAGGAALLVDPRSTNEISDAMLRLAGDEQLRQQLCAKGLQRAGRFSWKQTAEETLTLYRDLLG